MARANFPSTMVVRVSSRDCRCFPPYAVSLKKKTLPSTNDNANSQKEYIKNKQKYKSRIKTTKVIKTWYEKKAKLPTYTSLGVTVERRNISVWAVNPVNGGRFMCLINGIAKIQRPLFQTNLKLIFFMSYFVRLVTQE